MLLGDGKTIPISKVKPGEKVRATDPDHHVTAARPVVKVIRHHRWHAMAAVVLVTGAVIQATSQHPFWDATTRQFTYAADLRPGDKLLEPDGQLVGVREVRDYQADLTAYNLDVSGIHTYYVLAGATPVLVHNSCGDEQQSLFDEDPYRTGTDGKTRGTLNIDGEKIQLTSREPVLENYNASGHVEGQAALIMRERGAASATLEIDNPNGICGYCTSQVPTLLPEGATLDVQTPLGTVPRGPTWSNSRIFTGNARDPRPPPL